MTAICNPLEVRTRSVESDMARLRGARSIDGRAIEVRTAFRPDGIVEAPVKARIGRSLLWFSLGVACGVIALLFVAVLRS